MKHYDVLIATPGSSLVSQYVRSLTDTLTECDRRNITYRWLNATGPLIYHVRESTISGDSALDANDRGPMHDKVTYNKIIWIDSDIQWTVDDFFKLYDDNVHDIVCGAYVLSDGSTSVYSIENNTYIPQSDIQLLTDIIPIQSAGFGFICMNRGVFERIERPWFTHFHHTMSTDTGKMFNITLGEDVTWCVKAHQAGFNIYFNPKVLVTHIKTQPLKFM